MFYDEEFYDGVFYDDVFYDDVFYDEVFYDEHFYDEVFYEHFRTVCALLQRPVHLISLLSWTTSPAFSVGEDRHQSPDHSLVGDLPMALSAYQR